MQVNNVQQSPNFGMAVKIKPSASEFLKKTINENSGNS